MQGTHRTSLWFTILIGLASIFIIFIGFAPFIFSDTNESSDLLLLFLFDYLAFTYFRNRLFN